MLAGVDLDLLPGERLAVVGASGSGKSTLLHLLAGLLAPSAGEARVDDQDAASGGGRAAYMFQADLLLPWKSVLGNAVFAAEVAGGLRGRRLRRAALEAEARSILEEFGRSDVLDAMPRSLSGGMRQRIALARTLMVGRGLAPLDEPFGSLDMLTRAEMQRCLLDVMEAHPATWVLVTHDVREAALLCDRVAVLRGRPARLERAVCVPLDAAERRALALADPFDPADAGRAAPVRRSAAGKPPPAALLRQAVGELRGRLSAASGIAGPP